MMNAKQRVLSALKRQKPDRTPFMELAVDEAIGRAVTGMDDYGPKELAEALHLDGVSAGSAYPEILVRRHISPEGRSMITGGLLQNRSDLKRITLRDPCDDSHYDDIKRNVDHCGAERAVFGATNIGLDPLLLGMGIDNFAYALADDVKLIEEILDIYTEWAALAALKLQACGVDFIWFTDDLAYNSSMMFSPSFFREIAMPRLKKVTAGLKIPTVFHSDGWITPILDDIAELGIDAIHPIDPSALDIRSVKESHGSKFCLIGNIDLRHTLVSGAVEDVRAEVAERIRTIGYNGGYIVSSANSITNYCKVENVLAMRDAVEEFG